MSEPEIPYFATGQVSKFQVSYWNWTGPCGAPGHRSLSVSSVSCCREQTLASLPSMNSKGQIQRAANQGGEWMQRQGRCRCKEKIVQPLGQGPSSTSRNTHNNIFWALYRTKCVPAQSCSTLCSPRACQAPRSMEFPRKEYWIGLPFPPPENLPNPGIKPKSLVSPALAGKFFITVPPEKSCRIKIPQMEDVSILHSCEDHLRSS